MDSLCKLGWKQRCLRRNECRELTRQQIDLAKGVLSIPMTKNGKPHSLPITPMMREILERRCLGLAGDAVLFKGSMPFSVELDLTGTDALAGRPAAWPAAWGLKASA